MNNRRHPLQRHFLSDDKLMHLDSYHDVLEQLAEELNCHLIRNHRFHYHEYQQHNNHFEKQHYTR